MYYSTTEGVYSDYCSDTYNTSIAISDYRRLHTRSDVIMERWSCLKKWHLAVLEIPTWNPLNPRGLGWWPGVASAAVGPSCCCLCCSSGCSANRSNRRVQGDGLSNGASPSKQGGQIYWWGASPVVYLPRPKIHHHVVCRYLIFCCKQ